MKRRIIKTILSFVVFFIVFVGVIIFFGGMGLVFMIGAGVGLLFFSL